MHLTDFTPEQRAYRDAFITMFTAGLDARAGGPAWEPTRDHHEFQTGEDHWIDAQFAVTRANTTTVSLIQQYGSVQLEAEFPEFALFLVLPASPEGPGPSVPLLPRPDRVYALAQRLAGIEGKQDLLAFLQERLDDPYRYEIGLHDEFHELTPRILADFAQEIGA